MQKAYWVLSNLVDSAVQRCNCQTHREREISQYACVLPLWQMKRTSDFQGCQSVPLINIMLPWNGKLRNQDCLVGYPAVKDRERRIVALITQKSLLLWNTWELHLERWAKCRLRCWEVRSVENLMVIFCINRLLLFGLEILLFFFLNSGDLHHCVAC